MNTLAADVRSAFRTLAAARGFTAIAVMTLAAGIALSAIVLTVLNAYVVRGLPYPAADRLYRVDYAAPGQPTPRNLEQLDWLSINDLVEHHLAWDLDVFYLLGGEFPESAPGAWVTPGYMAGFGVRAAVGRAFDEADFRTGSPPVALISDRLWRTRFQADPHVVGRSFQAFVSDRPEQPESFTIVGVLPADWWHLNAYTEVLAPLKSPTYPYMVRLRTGVPATTAVERVDALVRNGLDTVPAGFNVALTSIHASYIAEIRPLLSAVATAAGLVLLIAGANVTVLLLVRGRLRQKELAVRLALGASHARVARLLALEGALVAAAAATVGILASRVAVARIGPLVEQFLARRVPGGVDALTMDIPLLVAAFTGGVLIAMAFTVAPLATILRANLSRHLSSGGRTATDAPGAGRTRAVLIGLEVAASLTLLTGAALMAETGLRMLRVDFGFDGAPVVTAGLGLRERSFPDEGRRAAFFERLITALDGVGGSRTVALGDWWPLQPARPRRVATGGATPVVGTASAIAVTADYFTALGMTIRDGRPFTTDDRLGSEPVIIVSESVARRLWPQSRAVGELLTIHPTGEGQTVTARVVGVVNDVRQTHTDSDLNDAYWPLLQHPGRFTFLYLRAPHLASWESELRAAVASVNREIAVGTPRPLEAALDQERARPRFLAYLLTVFAVFACVLALVGMYGVISYAARQRQREIAVRIAVGADRRAISGMFLRHGVLVLIAGLIAGAAGSRVLGRLLESQLFGVRANEPHVLIGAGIAFGLCALAAIWWPAWRAAAVDPVALLKDE